MSKLTLKALRKIPKAGAFPEGFSESSEKNSETFERFSESFEKNSETFERRRIELLRVYTQNFMEKSVLRAKSKILIKISISNLPMRL